MDMLLLLVEWIDSNAIFSIVHAEERISENHSLIQPIVGIRHCEHPERSVAKSKDAKQSPRCTGIASSGKTPSSQ
jgi:hypothetical protein